MKKIKSLKIITCLLLVFMLSIIMPNIKAYASKVSDDYEVEVTYGIEGRYKASKYLPVNIEVKALTSDFVGEVEVKVATDSSGSYDAFAKEVKINSGESVKVTIPVKFLENSKKAVVCLKQNNKTIYEEKVLVSAGRVSAGNVFAGILSDDSTALGYLSNISFESNSNATAKIITVNLNAELIDSNSLNIDALDLVIINNYNMANLNEEQYKSLNNWVKNGGTLLIGSGANESKTIGNINKNYFNISSTGKSEENITLLNDNLNLIISSLNVQDGEVLLSDEEKNLAFSKVVGEGKIIVSAFDIGLEPFISSNASWWTVKSILSSVFNKLDSESYKGGYSDGNYIVNSLLDILPISSILGIGKLITILIIYALIIGVLLYLLLKKLNKRELIWIAVPIISVIFTFVIFLAASQSKIKDSIINKVNIVNLNENGKGVVTGYIGIGNKNKGDLTVKKDSTLEMTAISNDDDDDYNDQISYEFNTLRLKTTYTGDNSYFTAYNNDALSMKKFKATGNEVVLSALDSDLNINNEILKGSVKNNFDSDITNLILVSGDNVWNLGALKKGEEIKIEDNSSEVNYGLQVYAEVIRDEYYNEKWNKGNPRQEKYKNIERISNLLNLIASGNYLGDNTSVFIAITDMDIDYSLDLDTKSISSYNTTALIQGVEIDFKDSEGNINYPEGFFKETIISKDNNISYDAYYGYIYGEGDIIFEYKIDKGISVNEITLKQGSDRWGNTSGSGVIYYVYNYESNEYEEIKLARGYYEFKDLDKYLKENVLNIKLNVSGTKGNAMIPKIAVKGSER